MNPDAVSPTRPFEWLAWGPRARALSRLLVEQRMREGGVRLARWLAWGMTVSFAAAYLGMLRWRPHESPVAMCQRASGALIAVAGFVAALALAAPVRGSAEGAMRALATSHHFTGAEWSSSEARAHVTILLRVLLLPVACVCALPFAFSPFLPARSLLLGEGATMRLAWGLGSPLVLVGAAALLLGTLSYVCKRASGRKGRATFGWAVFAPWVILQLVPLPPWGQLASVPSLLGFLSDILAKGAP